MDVMNFNDLIHYASTNLIMRMIGKNNNLFGKYQLNSLKTKFIDFNNEYDTHDECHEHEHEHCARTSNEGFEIGDIDMQ